MLTLGREGKSKPMVPAFRQTRRLPDWRVAKQRLQQRAIP